MIVGIGTDIIEVDRIRKSVEGNRRFLEKIFTQSEIAFFESRNMLMTSIAGTFAAKEAVSKVFATGIRGFKWTDIEIVRDELGKPRVQLFNEAKAIATRLNITEVMVSISHCDTYAVAYCVGVNQPQEGDV